MLDIQLRKEKTLTIIDMTGVFDNGAHNPVEEIVKNATQQESINLIWNFDGISSINSSGIAILLNACVEISKHGGMNKLVNVSPSVLEVFDIHKVLPAVDIFSDEETARKKIHIDKEAKEESYTRLFDRIDCTLKARFKKFKKANTLSFMNRFHTAQMKSISLGGVYLQTTTTEPANTLLDLFFILPGDSGDIEVNCVCKVVWAADREGQPELYPGLALSIVHLNSRERSKIETFLKTRET